MVNRYCVLCNPFKLFCQSSAVISFAGKHKALRKANEKSRSLQPDEALRPNDRLSTDVVDRRTRKARARIGFPVPVRATLKCTEQARNEGLWGSLWSPPLLAVQLIPLPHRRAAPCNLPLQLAAFEV